MKVWILLEEPSVVKSKPFNLSRSQISSLAHRHVHRHPMMKKERSQQRYDPKKAQRLYEPPIKSFVGIVTMWRPRIPNEDAAFPHANPSDSIHRRIGLWHIDESFGVFQFDVSLTPLDELPCESWDAVKSTTGLVVIRYCKHSLNYNNG